MELIDKHYKDLLCSTEKSTLYLLITYSEKESKKEYVYISITESLFCTPEPKYCKSTVLQEAKQKNNEENSTMIIFPLLKFSAKVIGTFQTTKPQISSF